MPSRSCLERNITGLKCTEDRLATDLSFQFPSCTQALCSDTGLLSRYDLEQNKHCQGERSKTPLLLFGQPFLRFEVHPWHAQWLVHIFQDKNSKRKNQLRLMSLFGCVRFLYWLSELSVNIRLLSGVDQQKYNYNWSQQMPWQGPLCFQFFREYQ